MTTTHQSSAVTGATPLAAIHNVLPVLRLIVLVVLLAASHSAKAHGIAGNRLFPGTLSFDDPAVADEFAMSLSSLKHPAPDGSNVVDDTISGSFMRLLTPTIGFGIDSGWIHRNWGPFQRSGFDTTHLTLKGLLYKNEPHEILVSAAFSWGIGGSGAQGVGAAGPHTLTPGLFFGKGFGDLVDSLSWLRPFAITGAVTVDFPTHSTSTIFGIDSTTGRLEPMWTQNVATLHWGFAIQYSTYYLTKRFTGGPPKEEPLHQLVPLVEFAFDSPRGQKTAATMNPGLAYVADTWQVAAEAILPLNSEGGRSVGVKTQLLFFLDDLIPRVFGKPLFGGK